MRFQTVQKDSQLLFVSHGRTQAVLYLGIVFFSYVTAIVFYPLILSELNIEDALHNHFFVFFLFSVFMSLSLLAVKSSYVAGIILLFRCYLIMIQGYGIEAFYTLYLILCLGLFTETGLLLKKPYNIIMSLLFILGILSSQRYTALFGHTNRYGPEVFASYYQIIILGFILFTFAVVVNTMVNQADKKEEMQKSLTLQKETMKALAEFNADLQSYARTVDIESSDRERNRISREIHDISGYIFTNLIALLNAACSIPPDDQLALSDILITARKQAHEGLNETRTALRKTREMPIPEEEGVRAINKIISIFQKVTGVHVSVNWGNTPHSFSREMNFTIYRTIQESLTNAIRHGLATEITIHFLIENSQLKLTIIDNGHGAESVVKGIGLTGMEERVGNLNGHVYMDNAAGGGFELNVIIPISENKSNIDTIS